MKKKFSYILFFIATVIWGLAFIAQKAAVLIPPFTVGAIRSLLASLFLLALIPIMDKANGGHRHLIAKNKTLDFTKRELIGGFWLGVIITVATAFQQYGLGEGTDAGKAAFITALYVVIVPIISIVLGKRPSILTVISIPIAIFGFYLLCIGENLSLNVSDLLVLVCAVIFAGHIIVVDHFSPGCDGVRMSFVQFFVAFILNSILAIIIDGVVDIRTIGSVIGSLLFLGIMSSGIAYTLQIIGQKDADPSVASMILSLEAVFGVIGGAILLKERMSEREIIGCVIVFCAVLMAQIEPSWIKKIFKRGK